MHGVVCMLCIASNLKSLTIVPVDSVKCIRPDSIIIGCFQLTEDGKEKSYLLQVITSRPGGITDVSAKSLHALLVNHELPMHI